METRVIASGGKNGTLHKTLESPEGHGGLKFFHFRCVFDAVSAGSERVISVTQACFSSEVT